MKEFLVGLENLYCDEERIVTVTDDTEGFGPGLLAEPGIDLISCSGSPPRFCAAIYASRHKLELPLRISVNLPDNASDAWRLEHHKSAMRIIDASELDGRFEEYYGSGERVEVEWHEGFGDYTGYGYRTNGLKARFYVGRSTGWKPIYLMVLQRNSSGGAAILSCAVKSIRGLGIYRHEKPRSPRVRVHHLRG